MSITALYVAAERCVETEREDRVLNDPFAKILAGKEGMEFSKYVRSVIAFPTRIFAVRGRWTDENVSEKSL